MKYDEIIQEAGGCGLYQKSIICVLYIALASHGFQVSSLVFTVPNIQHRCAIPGLQNDTYEVQDKNHAELISLHIPQHLQDGQLKYSRCYLYGNETLEGNETQHKCNSWVYDKSVFQTSITSDMNLVCDRKNLATFAMTAHFLGMTVGSLPSGWLADRFGRKTIIISGVVLQGISCLTLSQMQNIYAILSLRFLAAVADSGVVIPSAVFGAEITSKEGRKEAAIALHFSYAVGCLITSLFAYLIRNWSLLLLILSIQSLPMVFIYIWFVPESPRWLLAMKKYKSAETVFKKMAKMNKSDFIYNPEQEVEISDNNSNRTVKLWKMFTIPALLKRTLVMMFNWPAVSFVYYGLTMNTGNLSGNIYTNFFFNTLVEFPAYIICVLLLNRIGRKKLYSSFMIMGGITGSMVLLPALYAPKHLQWTVTVLAMLSRLCATGTFTVIFLYTCELYPTCIRNATLGAMSTIGRIGAAICPYVLRLPDLFPGKIGRSLPLVSMGAVCLISGILIQFLPETTNKALADDFEETKTLHLETRCETDKDLNESIPLETEESKC